MNIFEGLDDKLKQSLTDKFGIDKKTMKEKKQRQEQGPAKTGFKDKGLESHFLNAPETSSAPLDESARKNLHDRFTIRKKAAEKKSENSGWEDIEKHFLTSETSDQEKRAQEEAKKTARQKTKAYKKGPEPVRQMQDYESYFLSLDED